jgi:hypothetical protein
VLPSYRNNEVTDLNGQVRFRRFCKNRKEIPGLTFHYESLLTPLTRSRPEKLFVAKLVTIFTTSYESRWSLAVFARTFNGTYSEPVEFSPRPPMLYLKTQFNIILLHSTKSLAFLANFYDFYEFLDASLCPPIVQFTM